MATPPPPDTTDLRRRGRQRLIGAIAIVLLAVVFIPMALDPAPRTESRAPSLDIPNKDTVAPLPPPQPPVKSLAPSMAAAKPAAEPAKAAEAVPAPAAAPVSAPTATVAVRDPDPTPAAAVPPKEAPLPRLEGFAVQVGAFKDEDKLRQAREKLAAAKIVHFIERRPDGLTRLRTGPYPARPAAEKALVSVKAAGLDGQVVPLP